MCCNVTELHIVKGSFTGQPAGAVASWDTVREETSTESARAHQSWETYNACRAAAWFVADPADPPLTTGNTLANTSLPIFLDAIVRKALGHLMDHVDFRLEEDGSLCWVVLRWRCVTFASRGISLIIACFWR
jgi:hypothetical protein